MGDIIAKASGIMQCVSPANNSDYTLEELKNIVGGNIEIIDLGKRYLVVNEVGKLIRLPYNTMATNWMLVAIGGTDFVVGDALLCEKEHIK